MIRMLPSKMYTGFGKARLKSTTTATIRTKDTTPMKKAKRMAQHTSYGKGNGN